LVGIEFENFNLFENDTGEECVVSGESSRFRRGEAVLTLPPMLLLFLLNRSFGEQNALALDIPVFRYQSIFDSFPGFWFGSFGSFTHVVSLLLETRRPLNFQFLIKKKQEKDRFMHLAGIGRPAPGPTNNC
jgi:hypothetical protein